MTIVDVENYRARYDKIRAAASSRPPGWDRDQHGRPVDAEERAARDAYYRHAAASNAAMTNALMAGIRNGAIVGSWNSSMPLPVTASAPKREATVTTLADGRERRQYGPGFTIIAPAGSFKGGSQRRSTAQARPARNRTAAQIKAASDAAKQRHAARQRTSTRAEQIRAEHRARNAARAAERRLLGTGGVHILR
jgi:hypothetical protein